MQIFIDLDDLDLLLDLSWFIVNICIIYISRNARNDNSVIIGNLLDSGVIKMIKKSIFSQEKDLITAALRIIEFIFQGKKETNENLVEIFIEQ
jgi:hypothetical protein